ncbi:MAG: FAD-dependent monooxygenase [Goleter apudmare HA4340-LM2]|nr:FAD-dependent monooxygenase [Goleter apudmare HA4340-LM2]
MDTNTSGIGKENKDSHGNVLIIGGGPAGLATALMLAKRGWSNITVLEQRVAADYYEPDKAFNYLIDGRGQKLIEYLGIKDELIKAGVPSKELYLTFIQADGSRKTLNLPIIDPNRKTAYWISRKTFVLLLYQEIIQNWEDKITVFFQTKCTQISKSDNNSLEVFAESENGDRFKFEPDLLVGADGIHSVVRSTLREWEKPTSDRFDMKLFPSPSSSLRYKVLSLPPKFPLDHHAEEYAVSEMTYAIRGAFSDRRRSISLGILPIKNPDEARTANIITPLDHEIWKLKNGEELYQFLEEAFPQLPIRQIISPEEAERFAKSEGGYFPIPQYCSGFYCLLQQGDAVGVVLIGDTIHCFPPDIGQGVNAALEDVYILNEALSKSDDDISFALPLYESLRIDDTKALVRLAQTSFPWQYNQDRLRQFLWGINFFLRLKLSRLLPYLFSPQSFFLIQNYQLSYQEVLVKERRTTQMLYLFSLMTIFGILALFGILNYS